MDFRRYRSLSKPDCTRHYLRRPDRGRRPVHHHEFRQSRSRGDSGIRKSPQSHIADHNQRNHVRVRLSPTKDFYWIEDIIDLVEKELSCPIYPLLKREDEKWQTELMYEEPKFVEDVVRLLGVELDKELDNRITDYVVVVNHEESIHTHTACAILNAGRELA